MSLDSIASLFSRIQSNLGRGSQVNVVNLIPDWTNLVQRELCLQGKWFFNFNEDTSSFTLTQGVDTITLPTDFVELEYIFIQDSDGNVSEVCEMEETEYRQQYSDSTDPSFQATPLNYLLRSADVLFRPIPDDTYSVIFGYWNMLADLVSGGAVNKLVTAFPTVLECGATQKGFEYMQQYEDATYWKGRYTEEVTKMRVANAERQLPGDFILSVRPGQKTSRISRRIRRVYW